MYNAIIYTCLYVYNIYFVISKKYMINFEIILIVHNIKLREKKNNYNNISITIIFKMSCDEIVNEQSLDYTKCYLQKKKK